MVFTNLILLLFSFGALQGFLLAILLKVKYKDQQVNYLVAICSLFSLLMVYYILFWSKVRIPLQLVWVQHFTFVIGPLFYGIMKSIPFNAAFNTRYAWHFLAFPLIAAMVYLPIPRWLIFYLQPAHMVFYAVLAFYEFRKRKNPHLAWLTVPMAGYAGMFVIYALMVTSRTLTVEADYMISVAMCGFIYSLMFKSFLQPQFLSQLKPGSQLSPALVETMMTQIHRHFENKKPYLSGDFRLSDLASALGIKPYQLSEIVNLHYDGFQQLLAEYRIRESKGLLNDPDIKIIEVAFMSGFNNKVTFYKSFRKATGMTPIEWREKEKTVNIYMN